MSNQPTTTNVTDSDHINGRQKRLVRHLDLFSGIGGFALAAQWVGGIETIGFCEIDEWAQKVLKKNFPNVPIHGDVKTLDPKNYERTDFISCGYPCQPFSVAGKQRGAEDDRHLWPEVFRIIKEARPSMVLCENVAGHVSMGLDEVLSDLESEGYSAEPIIIPACAVDASHRRDRVWIMAHSESGRSGELRNQSQKEGSCSSHELLRERSGLHGKPQTMANTEGQRLQGIGASGKQKPHPHEGPRLPLCCGEEGGHAQWPFEPAVGRVAHGIPDRTHRLRGLGNAIVPQVAAEILRVMMNVNNR